MLVFLIPESVRCSFFCSFRRFPARTINWTEKKKVKHKHFGRDGVQDKRGSSWDKPTVFCLVPQSNRHFAPFVARTGGGSFLGRLSRNGRQQDIYVFQRRA